MYVYFPKESHFLCTRSVRYRDNILRSSLDCVIAVELLAAQLAEIVSFWMMNVNFMYFDVSLLGMGWLN